MKHFVVRSPSSEPFPVTLKCLRRGGHFGSLAGTVTAECLHFSRETFRRRRKLAVSRQRSRLRGDAQGTSLWRLGGRRSRLARLEPTRARRGSVPASIEGALGSRCRPTLPGADFGSVACRAQEQAPGATARKQARAAPSARHRATPRSGARIKRTESQRSGRRASGAGSGAHSGGSSGRSAREVRALRGVARGDGEEIPRERQDQAREPARSGRKPAGSGRSVGGKSTRNGSEEGDGAVGRGRKLATKPRRSWARGWSSAGIWRGRGGRRWQSVIENLQREGRGALQGEATEGGRGGGRGARGFGASVATRTRTSRVYGWKYVSSFETRRLPGTARVCGGGRAGGLLPVLQDG